MENTTSTDADNYVPEGENNTSTVYDNNIKEVKISILVRIDISLNGSHDEETLAQEIPYISEVFENDEIADDEININSEIGKSRKSSNQIGKINTESGNSDDKTRSAVTTVSVTNDSIHQEGETPVSVTNDKTV